MKRALILLASFALSAPAFAQKMEPGEWLMTTTTTSPDLPKPEVDSQKVCMKKEDVEDEDRWGGSLGPGCKRTVGKKTADSYTWKDSCPKAGVGSSGAMRWTSTTMNGDIVFVAPDKTEIRVKISGKRLGPCKK